MSKIPKEIVEKIKERNRLSEEIADWCINNLDMDGMDPANANILHYHSGDEQGDDGGKEWCDQSCIGEDYFYGEYYWETECPGEYLHMHFDMF